MKSKTSLVLKVLLSLVIIAAIGFGVYYFLQYRKVVQNPDIVSKQELTWVLERVNKLMELPQDETPTLATVLNKDELKDQDFFKNAENGDKVLVYDQAKKAILYRPNTNKIIEVMPIYNDEAQKAADSGAITSSPKIALYNGTDISGLTNSAETKIREVLANVEVTTKANAKNTNYSKTLVVDLKGDMSAQAQKIADILDGEVGTMPANEDRPDADILVILAN